MSASTGGGHNRAAKAIKEELENRKVDDFNIECHIIDSLKLVNTTVDKVISNGYEKSALYTPKAYGSLYRISENSFISRNEFKHNPLTSFMAIKFAKLIREYKPDIIIGTHPFPMIALSMLKKNSDELKETNKNSSETMQLITEPINMIKDPLYKVYSKLDMPPLISVLTDYTTHSTWLQNEISYYIVGHEYVKELLIDEGVPESKIKTFGIPVEKSFLSHRPKDKVLEELGLDPSKTTLLLMGGSFGAGNIKETFQELIDIERDFQIIAIAGKNETLKEKLNKKLSTTITDKKIVVLGFVKNMNDILASVDVIVTKPGGLTTTEALLKGVPMIVPFFIPGQEEENLEFLMNCGVALTPTKKYTLSILVRILIDSPIRLQLMRENINAIKKDNSAEKIANLILSNLQ
jgi:processive 1,2-diacylglycerol beta-glucosyltransferase